MKDEAALQPSPQTPFEQFTENMRRVLSVSKKDSDEHIKQELAKRKRRKTCKESTD